MASSIIDAAVLAHEPPASRGDRVERRTGIQVIPSVTLGGVGASGTF